MSFECHIWCFSSFVGIDGTSLHQEFFHGECRGFYHAAIGPLVFMETTRDYHARLCLLVKHESRRISDERIADSQISP